MANALREKVAAGGLATVMAAHNPLSARLAEEAGFDGIWASGFELSAAYGLPDASLLSFTQHLDMTRAIIEQVNLPMIADLDTGYGNAINVGHVVGAYARAGAAAVVIEDKTFPKDTSLLAGARQELIRIEEFQGKIEAARAAAAGHDLLVIARTEALIADLGMDEALRRGAAYAEAGADLLLIHSKQKTPDEIVAFTQGVARHDPADPGADRLSRPDRSESPRARQDRHHDLRQPRGARRGHRDARGVRRDPPRRRHPPGRQAHRLGRGDLRIAAGAGDESRREAVSAVASTGTADRPGSSFAEHAGLEAGAPNALFQ